MSFKVSQNKTVKTPLSYSDSNFTNSFRHKKCYYWWLKVIYYAYSGCWNAAQIRYSIDYDIVELIKNSIFIKLISIEWIYIVIKLR
jgi:hypothetical protein